ncbi:MAG: carboxylesterase family protein, partial [Gammaproteobacteria bacterium]|nr:carboxylesterase family protein [Gammaproteobacteria bacterium]
MPNAYNCSHQLAMPLLASIVGLTVMGCAKTPSAEDRVLQLLVEDAPYHAVSPELFAELGWDLPDGGETVKQLADAAPGGAFDPRALESIPADTLGYTADWQEVRFAVYGLDWDIGGLHLVPRVATRGLPTVVIINGGAANWYEFFIGPTNRAGLGQYLAQRVPVLLVTIPGNYRHGGWSETDFGKRIPAYLLDRDVPAEEASVRNAIYTFRVVTAGVKALLDAVVPGPVVVIGHSTGGEV